MGRKKRANLGIDYSKDSDADVIADAHFLPFRDNTFEEVISVSVLKHSPNPLNFLREQYRVLTQHGYIQIVTDNAQFYLWSVMKFRGLKHEDYHTKSHYMIFYPKNVIRLMKLADFDVRKCEFVNRDKRKLDILFTLLIRIGIFRASCLYQMSRVQGVKQSLGIW